ncbi:MAG TPA: hypothetical protein VGB37_04815 [Candidatus Lokiarchaeia archaeon]
MSPIITHEDELELAKIEKQLASQLKKMAGWQRTIKNIEMKLADNLSKMNIARQVLTRIFRDTFNQMQTLAREHRSNVGDEEIKQYEDIIHANDTYLETVSEYINAIKNLAIRKEDLAIRKESFAEALSNVADKRSGLIKKALSLEKTKNKLIEGEKLTALENDLNDSQREFDRARDILLKELELFLQSQSEINKLWIDLKNSIKEMS